MAITVEQAIKGYTADSAYSEFNERENGSLAVGKLSDMIILSDDPLACDVDFIKDIKVEKTIVGGEIVYDRK